MEAKIVVLAPEPTARGAMLKFTFEVTFTAGDEMPLSAVGYLLAPHNVIVCPLSQVPIDQDIETSLRGSDGYGRPKETTRCYLAMVALLGTSDLDYLSDLRTKDPKGDVHLNIKLGVRCLRSASTVIHLEKGPTKGSAASAVIQARPTRGSQALVGEGHDGFVKTTTVPLQVSHRIPGNDWTHDFAPKFGLGRFIVFEIPQPSIVGAGPIEQRAALALDAARKSEALLGEGKWAEACTALRPAWELLRDSTDVEDLLVKEGYTGAAATAFDQATNQLFQFASKFMHALDKHANVIANPDIRASKEEAQLVFVTAMGFINLIAQKLRKLK